MAIMTSSQETITKDADGNIISTELTTDSKNIHKSEEGDFIKIYIEGLNNLPDQLTLPAFRLLIQMAQYASYADINDLEGGLLIQLSTAEKEDIQYKLNIQERAYYKNLKNLLDLKLIREVKRNCYQLNPTLIGKGYFEYKANYKQGGIKDLREYWSTGCQPRTVEIEDNRFVLSQLVEEVRKLGKKLKHAEYAKNYKLREEVQAELFKYLNGMKELSTTEYSKNVKYLVDNGKEIQKLKEKEEQEIQAQKEDAEIQAILDGEEETEYNDIPEEADEYKEINNLNYDDILPDIDDPFGMFS